MDEERIKIEGYSIAIERGKIAKEIADYVLGKYEMTALEYIAILEEAKRKGLSRTLL